MQNAPDIIQVLEVIGLKSSQFQYNEGGISTLWWGPLNGITTDGVTLSPTVVLDHEADHGVEAIYHNKEYTHLGNIPDKAYDDKEEKRVITGREQKTARALGEIKNGQITRNNHNRGRVTRVTSPTSTQSSSEKNIFNQLKKGQEFKKQNLPKPPRNEMMPCIGCDGPPPSPIKKPSENKNQEN